MTEGVVPECIYCLFPSFLNGSIIPKSVIPEWFYQESKLFKGKNIWIPDKRFQA